MFSSNQFIFNNMQRKDLENKDKWRAWLDCWLNSSQVAGSDQILLWLLWGHVVSQDLEFLYRKFPKYSDTQKICCTRSKIWTMWLYHRVMSSNDADRLANSVDPDQTLGAVWSGSALFAQTCLSENLGTLWYALSYQRKIPSLTWH